MKTKLLGTLIIVFGVFLLAGLASASDVDLLQPASTVTYDEDLTVNGIGRFKSVYIGKQGSGGVTFFQGTMNNSTVGENNFDNPITIGDNLRVDGRVYRGVFPGSGDNMPFIINDDLKIAGDLLPTAEAMGGPGSQTNTEYNNLGSSAERWGDIFTRRVITGGLRVGQIYRGQEDEDNPIKFEDSIIPSFKGGRINLGSDNYRWGNIYSESISTSKPIKHTKSDGDPYACSSEHEGEIYYNSDDNNFYGCRCVVADCTWVRLNN